MKKNRIPKVALLPLLFLSIVSMASADNNLRSLMLGDKGKSNSDVKLNSSQEVSFTPAQAKTIFALDANSDLVVKGSENDNLGFTHYRFYQNYQGIPIENTMYIAHVKNGVLKGMSGSIILDFDPNMTQRNSSSLNEAIAINTSLKFVHASKYAWNDATMEQRIKSQTGNPGASYYPTASLVWYAPGDEIEPRDLMLCYKVDVYAKEPLSRAFYFVDAQSGKVLGQKDVLYYSDATGTAATAYSGTQTIHSDLNGSAYRLRDLTKGNGVITLTSAGADYSSTSANWSLTGTNQYALDAHYGVSQTYAFYLANFGRNSVDNAGFALTSYVNESATKDNAYWDGTSMHFGNRSSNGSGITGIDVDGHELTHGVTQYTSNLNYSNQSGAMNESMSDIFGKSVQFWSKPTDVNWKLSNDMGWLIRDMANPNAYSQPDTYLGTNWYSGTSDNGGVHTNSGVGNYMFYLLVTGGSGTNDIGNAFTVSGLGLTKADAILYRSETVYLTPTSQYSNWRTACMSAATDLYGAASNELNQVMNSWYAVGIGTAGNSGTCAVAASLAASAITNTTATLSWGAVTGAASYMVQYKTAAATAWTSVSATSTSVNLSGLVSGTTYNYQVQTVCTAGGSSAFTTAASFLTTGTAPISYCTSVGLTTDGLTNVTFNTINNVTSGATAGYTDYTASQSTTVNQGTVYTLSAKINTGGNYTNYAKAWIDWNHDGTFSTTTEEYNLGTAVNVTNGTTSLSPLSVTVPAGAVIGSTRMRVSTQYNAAPTPCLASFDGEVEDYTIVVAAGSSCATPSSLAAGSVSASGAILSWASTGAVTYNLQWKLASAIAWTLVSGLTTTSYTLSGLVSCTAYNYQVQGVCSSAIGAYSSSASFTTTGCAITYCTSKGSNATYEYINRVALGSINNTSGNNSGYGNFTAQSTNLAGGTANTITLVPGFKSSIYTEGWNVWIDYNHNGLFTDAGEKVATGTGTSTLTKSFTVPTTALNGAARMRVQMQYSTAPTTSCLSYTYGEVEDYTVNVTGNAQFSIAGNSLITAQNNVERVIMYPNPVRDNLTVEFTAASANTAKISFSNLMGQQVMNLNQAVVEGINVLKLTTTNLPQGVYIFEMTNNGKLYRQKFIVAE